MTQVVMDRPVRLQADLGRPPGIPPGTTDSPSWIEGPFAVAGMRAVLDAGAFFLQLGYPPQGGEGSKRFMTLVRQAAARGMRVSVILAGAGADAREAAEAGACEATLDLAGMALDVPTLRRLEAFRKSAGEGVKTGALLRLDRETFPSLGPFLDLAADVGLDFVELPPLPLALYPSMERARALPGPGEYRALLVAPESVAAPLARLGDARIHDILLWSILRRLPGAGRLGESRFHGCQAAGALGYVDPDGIVRPCALLDLPLGRVEELADEGFWQRPPAVRARELAAGGPSGCRACGVLDSCRGGCPGARLAAAGRADGDDPLCAVFRELTP